MSEFNVVQLAGVSLVTITGPAGPTGATGATGAMGPGVGPFQVDMNGDLMPTTAIIASSLWTYDSNSDLEPS